MTIWSFARLLALVLVFTSCTPIPKQTLSKRVRASIQTIALMETNEPAEFQVMNIGGAPLVFGALGVVASAGDVRARNNSLTQAMQAREVWIGRDLATHIESSLRARGVRIYPHRVERPAANRKGEIDYKNVVDGADAVLDMRIGYAGYVSKMFWADYEPWISVTARLASPESGATLYTQVVSYGIVLKKDKKIAFIPADEKLRYGTFEKLLAAADPAAAGLKEGVRRIAERISRDLR